MSEPKPIKRTYLGMPCHGSITAGSSIGWTRASQRPGLNWYYMEGSLLANCFNNLWCWALNGQAKGEQVDYFAMQHADIEPEQWWLDRLIDEMESKNLDFLGVHAPIKDMHGLTSTALGIPGETWRVKCRLTLKEVHRLPQTITSDDFPGYQLLCNTGLWVCRFNPEWNTKVHFRINDRIVFDTTRGLYLAEVEPEDWYFSRLLHELGLRVGATRIVQLDHRGGFAFSNRKPWGDEFDKAYLKEALVPPEQPPTDFRWPLDVDGWLTQDEGRKLSELAKGKECLEVGSFQGKSTICIGQTATSVVSVDPHDGRGTPCPGNTFEKFKDNLDRYQIRNVRSSDGSDLLSSDMFDFVFIDGSHEYEDVKHDIERSLTLLRPDGLIAFHDYKSARDPGVTQAVDEFLSAGADLVSLTDTLAVVRPVAALTTE